MDISSILTVQISYSQFIGNNVTSLNDNFRAGAAGISIAYNFLSPISERPTLIIEKSHFINNTATTPSLIFDDQVQSILKDNIYPARGGAIGMVIIDSFSNVNALIEYCEFSGNYAGEVGGAIYICKYLENYIPTLQITLLQHC